VARYPESYQHINPDVVGNKNRVVVSDLSGRSNILFKAEEFGLLQKESSVVPLKTSIASRDEWLAASIAITERVKSLEASGYTFEGAEASLDLVMRQAFPKYRKHFELVDYSVTVADGNMKTGGDLSIGEDGQMKGRYVGPSSPLNSATSGATTRATVKLDVFSETKLEVAEGNGPVNAIDGALTKALMPTFPLLKNVELVDYKVRIVNSYLGTAATTRVLITFSYKESRDRDVIGSFPTFEDKSWTTVGAGTNLVTASLEALLDGYEYFLVKYSLR